ncbi:MAG: AGE family epimerase/isomerase [Blautia sp.]|nr:AGE family epimerase/isomerase [Blautia sp.]
MSEQNRKYRIDTDENRAFLRELTEDLLNFGHQFPSPGGASYYLGDDGTPWKGRNRETWITCRMAHVYSIGSFLGHAGSEELVDAALKGLHGELKDTVNGGWYPGRTPEDQILPDKQCYAHAFVILAATSGLLAGRPGAKDLLDDALALYDLRFWNEEEGLACDTWNTEFTVLDDYRGLNANMHTVEAFLAVADVAGREEYRVRAGRIIDHVLDWASHNHWRIPEHFTKDWTPDLECNKEKPDDPFKPYGATPGHGIEWSRLITQWALSTYGEDGEKAAKYLQAAEKLYDRAVSDAWNADGARGIVYTTDWDGKPVVHDRMHWTLAEAINTSAVLYRVTGKQNYADDYAEYLKYLDEQVLDHVHGSWFHQLDQENHLMETVWPGKSDLYHALQATLIPYHKVSVSIAPAVKRQEVVK